MASARGRTRARAAAAAARRSASRRRPRRSNCLSVVRGPWSVAQLVWQLTTDNGQLTTDHWGNNGKATDQSRYIRRCRKTAARQAPREEERAARPGAYPEHVQ